MAARFVAASARAANPLKRRRLLATASDAIEERDIVLVGGGVAGLSQAAALATSPVLASARRKLSLTLVEASDLSRATSWSPRDDGRTFENRTVSVTNESKALLERMGAWQHVDTSRVRGVERMEVWDGLSDARITFDADEVIERTSPLRSDDAPGLGEPVAMAHLTENANLTRALLKTLAPPSASSAVDIDIASSARVESIERDMHGWPILVLTGDRRIRTRLLIGADGFNSPVRKFAGIGTTGWRYDTEAVVASLEVEPSYNATAWQRFLPTGPIAFLPLTDTIASLVWSTKPPLARALKRLHPETVALLINAAFRLPWASIDYLHSYILDESHDDAAVIEQVLWRSSPEVLGPAAYGFDGPASEAAVPPTVFRAQRDSVASFPLRMSHAIDYIGRPLPDGAANRTVLLGDAAGQGLNLGLADVASLTSTLERAVLDGADIGSLTALRPYARARYSANNNMLSATDKLHKLFALQTWPIVRARSIGVEVINELKPLKRLLMGQAGADPARAQRTTAESLASTVNSLQSTLRSARAIGNIVADIGMQRARDYLKTRTPRPSA